MAEEISGGPDFLYTNTRALAYRNPGLPSVKDFLLMRRESSGIVG